jgi:hypothetical protein
MSSHESDPYQSEFIIHFNRKAVVIPFNVEYTPVVLKYARCGIVPLDIMWRLPGNFFGPVDLRFFRL